MPDIAALKAELSAGHPGTGAYNADDELAAGELNAVNRTKSKATMTASEIYNAVDSAGYVALTAVQQAEVWNILHMGEINPFGLEATRFTSIFGGGSTTITALASLRKDAVRRAEEIGLGFISPGHVTEARAF